MSALNRSARWFAPIAVLFALPSCSSLLTTDGAASADGAGEARLQSGQAVHLRTTGTGQYLVAEEGGGGAVHANRSAAGSWETFTLVTPGGGGIESGAQVLLRTSGGQYLQAAQGGGAGVNAASGNDGPWETFTLEKSGDRVSLRADDGHYVCAEGGGGGEVNANRPAAGPWETFQLEVVGAEPGPGPDPGPGPGPSGDGVLPEDTVLVPPQSSGAVLGTVTGYEMNSACPFADSSRCELPMYSSYDRDTPEFWDIMVQELLHSRVNVVMAHGRGCYDPVQGEGGNGNMCPRLLSRLVAAIDRAGARGVLRLGMFDDTGAYQGTRNQVESRPDGTRFDVGDHSSWRFFWDHNMKVWFDTVPKELWYRLDGRPVVAFWTLSSYFFSNQRNNASLMLRELRRLFIERYGEDPAFILDSTWVSEDPTITTGDAVGVNDWFNPQQSNYTFHTWNGGRWGATVPGFRDPDTVPGCGAACREYRRNDGSSLRQALSNGANARFMLLEGWTDIAESAGYYRSGAWRYPNQYIEIVREFADPKTPTLRLEAEAADELSDHSAGNLGGAYRGGDLDVGKLPGSGWFVGWTEPGEWLRFKEVALACGEYRFTARVASPLAGQKISLSIAGQSLGEVAVPNTGSWESYQLVHLGTRRLAAGHYDLQVDFPTGGLNLDWTFVRKSAEGCP